MENVETSLLDVSLTIDVQSDQYLRETAKWNKFLAILSFIFTGIIILLGVFLSAGMSFLPMQMPFESLATLRIVILIYVLVVGALTIIPNIYRYRFAAQMVQALDSHDQASLTTSFGNLKSFYRFYGILTIIGISLYALIFLFAALGGLMR